jgi:hypothetical protein
LLKKAGVFSNNMLYNGPWRYHLSSGAEKSPIMMLSSSAPLSKKIGAREEHPSPESFVASGTGGSQMGVSSRWLVGNSSYVLSVKGWSNSLPEKMEIIVGQDKKDTFRFPFSLSLPWLLPDSG